MRTAADGGVRRDDLGKQANVVLGCRCFGWIPDTDLQSVSGWVWNTHDRKSDPVGASQRHRETDQKNEPYQSAEHRWAFGYYPIPPPPDAHGRGTTHVRVPA